MTDRVRVVGICGSLEPDSKTLKAMRIAGQAAEGAGAQLDLIDLRDHPLPMLYSPFAPTGSEELVESLKERVRSADALLIGSPEYHGSYSGALKNAFDLMGFDEFQGKMVALLGVAGGPMGATNALNHLRVVCRQLHAWVLPDQVSVSQSWGAFDDEGNPKDSKVHERLQSLGVQLVKFATLHREASSNAFVQMWEQSVQNPGGEA